MLASHARHGSGDSGRALAFIAPVTLLSVALNIPRFYDLKAEGDGEGRSNL